MTATGFTVHLTEDPAAFLAAAEPHLALDPVLSTVVSSVTHRALEGLEERWLQRWKDQGTYAFVRPEARSQVFSIDTPPPTVSGSLGGV